MSQLSDIGNIKSILSRHGFSFSKSLGQNFLVNPGVCPRMAEECGAREGVCALEIGPGIGVLTYELARRADKVAAIEGSGEEITVKALSAGKANITVRDGSAAVTCRVTVTKGGSGGSSGGGCNSGLAAVVLAALIPLFFRRKSKAVH